MRILIPLHNFLFCSFSALCSNFNPRNTSSIPAVKILASLENRQNFLFCNGLIILILFFSATANCGMVVTDPSSYSYYVEQIKQATESVKKAGEQVNTLKAVYDTNTETLNQLRGVYSSGRTAVGALQDKMESAKKIESALKKYKRLGKDGDFVDAKKIMEDIFRDPREEPESVWRDADRRYDAEQTAVKGVITDADSILNAMPARFDIVQELLGEIGRTENIKAAMDLQNRISAEMLQVLLEMLNFSAKVAQAENMLQYTGVNDAATERRMQEKAEEEKNREHAGAWMEKMLKKSQEKNEKLGLKVYK